MEEAGGRVSERSKAREGVFDGFRHCIERWHQGQNGSIARFAYDYHNGDGEFLFLHSRDSLGSALSSRHAGYCPEEITSIVAQVEGSQPLRGKIWREAPDLVRGKHLVVCGRDKQLMFVENVHLVEQDELVIPSRIRLQVFERAPDLFGGEVYLSAFKGALDAFHRRGFGKRELHPIEGSSVGAVGRYEFPHSVVESGAEVVDGVTNHQTEASYRGLVALCSDGSFSKLMIGFEDIAKRAAFIDEFVGVGDVLFGPLNFEIMTDAHEQIPQPRNLLRSGDGSAARGGAEADAGDAAQAA